MYSRADDQYPERCKAEDFQRNILPVSHHDILVPFFLIAYDMIWIKGDDPIPCLAKVLEVQD